MRLSLQSTRDSLEGALREHRERNFTTAGCDVQLVDMDDETHTLDKTHPPWPHRLECAGLVPNGRLG